MPVRMEISSVGEANKDMNEEFDGGKIDERMLKRKCGEFYDASDEFQSDQEEGKKKPNRRE